MVYDMCIYLGNTTYINEATGILVCYLLFMLQLPTLETPPKQVGNLTNFGDCLQFQGMLVRKTRLVFFFEKLGEYPFCT